MNRRFLVWSVTMGMLTSCAKPSQIEKAAAPREPSTPAFTSVVVNGGFEEDRDDDGKPDGWQLAGGAQRIRSSAAGQWGLEVSGTSSAHDPRAVQTIAMTEPPSSIVTVACLLKAIGVRPVHEEAEGVAKLTVSFLAQDGSLIRSKTLGGWDGTVGWRPWAGIVRVPAEARTLELALVLSEATGRVLFDEVELLWQLPDDYNRENLLVDGGFEYYSPWSLWDLGGGQKVVYPGLNSHGMLKIGLPRPGRSVASQRLVIDDAASITEAAFSCVLKLKEVQEAQPGGGAKAEIRFWDDQRRLLEPVVTLGPWKGTTKTHERETWKRLHRPLTIPAEAREAVVSLMIDGASGVASFDRVRLTARAGGDPILRRLESRTDTATWQAFTPGEGPLAASLDASTLLDPPAGRHGFLAVRDGHFAFEDGTPVRFFGVNLDGSPALPTHEQAEQLAQRLGLLGCNIVRLHHLDAAWAKPNIFDQAHNDTQHLSAESLDRLDYLIAQLKAHGIYVYLDLLVSRKFKAGDGVAGYRRLSPGAKVVSQFSASLIALQKQYARQLLTHYNPYTGSRLVDEPALALVEIVNESSLFPLAKRLKRVPPVYLEELRRLWVEHLIQQGVSNPQAQADRYRDGEDPDVNAFYVDLQQDYFQQMHAYLRSLGLEIPIAGSNFALEGWDLATNASLDFIDRHAYWDPPRGTVGDLAKFHNLLMIKATDSDTLVARLSRLRVAGKPFVVSEWNLTWPNEYRAVGPLLMAAYASFQEWNGLIQFSYQGDLEPTKIESNFDVSTKPELFLQFPTAARLFHRQDIRPAINRHAYPVLTESPAPGDLALRHGIARMLDGEGPQQPGPMPGESPWISDTGELRWDEEQGVVLIETPRTQAALGRLGGVPVALRDVTFAVTTPFAALILTSLDDQPLGTSRHLLLTTVARSENTGTIYNATRTLLRDSGTAPIVLEPVEGTTSLRLGARGAPTVFALDAGGRRSSSVTVWASEGSVEIPLGGAHAYEILLGEPS